MVDLRTVQYAILETNGQISALVYPAHQPPTAREAGVAVEATQLPVTIISSGKLLRENLPVAGRTEAWVKSILAQHQCDVSQVYLLTVEPGGQLYLSVKEQA